MASLWLLFGALAASVLAGCGTDEPTGAAGSHDAGGDQAARETAADREMSDSAQDSREDGGAGVDSGPDGPPEAVDGAPEDSGHESGTADAADADAGPVTGGSCQTAFELGAGSHTIDTSQLSNTFAEYAGRCAASPNRVPAQAPEAFVSVAVPSGHRLELRATPESSSHALTLVLLASCARPQTECLHAVTGNAGQALSIEHANIGAETQLYRVIIDGANADDHGKVKLEVSTSAPSCGNGRIERGESCDDGRPPATGDGCDASCKVEPGYVCTTEVEPSVCRVRLRGDSCDDPFFVANLPFSATGNTATATGDYATGRDACFKDLTLGTQAPDHVYAFTPSSNGLHAIEVHGVDFSPALYVVTDCGDVNSSCVAGTDRGDGGDRRLLVELTAGTTYHVIVDATEGQGSRIAGNYQLGITAGCPDCTGEDCLRPFLVDAVPFTATRDLALANDDHLTGGCPNAPYTHGRDTGDHSYRFLPEVSGAYRIRLNTLEFLHLYVLEDCGSGLILGGECLGSTYEEALLTLEAGKAYSIIVEGSEYTQPGDAAPYVLEVSGPCIPDCSGNVCGSDGCLGSCGTCERGTSCRAGQCSRAGDSCAEPIIVGSVPFSDVVDGSLFNDDLRVSSCTGASSELGSETPEAVYRFTPQVTGIYTIDVAAEDGFDTSLYVITDCAAPASSCLRGVDTFDSAEETLQLTLSAGRTYYLVVDGYGSITGPSFQLDISDPCVPDCTGKACGSDGCGGSCGSCDPGFCVSGQCRASLPGDSCQDPILIASLPFSESNDSTPFGNQHSHVAGVCTGNLQAAGGAGRDVVYSFTPETTGSYTIALQEESWDGALYVATDCARISSTCIASADVTSGAGESITATVEAGQRYFVFVDGWSSTSDEHGVYAIELRPPCAGDCTAKVCGDDGCGGSCGTCSAGACSFGQCGAPAPGDTCENAFPIASLPFSDTRNTQNFANQYAHAAGACPGNPLAGGAGSRDAVYAFTPVTSATYEIRVQEAAWDSVVYVTKDCANISASCLMGSDTGFQGDGETVIVQLAAGVQYFIVVDGWDNDVDEAGPYTIDLAPLCIPDCSPLVLQ
jgi:cysteine-rich repeat protein